MRSNLDFVQVDYRGYVLKISWDNACALSRMGVDINEVYLDSLAKYSRDCFGHIVPGNIDFDFLMRIDICYRSHMFSGDSGWVTRYDVDGNVLSVARSYEDLANMIQTHTGLCLYGFSSCETCMVPTRRGVNFFGKIVKQQFDQKSSNLLLQSWLNGMIREAHGDLFRLLGVDAVFVRRAFKFYYFLFVRVRQQNLKLAARKNIEYSDFSAVLDLLFERHESFMQVFDLNAVTISSGIYMLVFDDLCGVYIGQTRKGVVHRICQHFISPSTDFDRTFGLLDISRIYVMSCDVNMLDKLEQDCIACLGRDFVVNALGGGYGVPLVNSPEYNELDYLLSDDIIAGLVADRDT